MNKINAKTHSTQIGKACPDDRIETMKKGFCLLRKQYTNQDERKEM